MTAQIRRFESVFGRAPTHVDGHNHIHVDARIAPTFASTLTRCNIMRTRVPVDESMASATWLGHDRHAFLSRVSDNGRGARAVFKEHGIASTDSFIGLTLTGDDFTFDRLTAQLLQARGLLLMVSIGAGAHV